MKIKLVADSSANLLNGSESLIASVPLTIVAGSNEYVDNDSLNVQNFVDELSAYKGKSSTACPGLNDWLQSFDDADLIFIVTLTGHLSGCYNSARAAADLYMEENDGKKVFVLDSLSTGPEMELIVERTLEYMEKEINNNSNLNADEVFEKISKFMTDCSRRTHLAFSLKSLSNFAKNGRVNAHLARAAELLHIHIVGRASETGDLEPLDKSRGENRAISQIFKNMKTAGFNGHKVIIRHTFNEEGARSLMDLIKKEFPLCEFKIGTNRGLCSYYAEPGSILVGFES